MSRLLNIIQRTPLYASLLERVPEAEREAAIATLEAELRPYEALITGLPQGALDNFLTSLNKDAAADPNRPTQRAPRRF